MNDHITKIDNFMRPLALPNPEFGPPRRVFRVGGSVRDEILGLRCKDADYVVFGIPLESLGRVLKMSREFAGAQVSPLKLRDGRQAGWRLFKKGYGLIEIMLPRTEVSTGSGHRDFKIVLDPSLTLEQDALRRDFTWNALYKEIVPEDHGQSTVVIGSPYAVLTGVHDPLGRGLYDLQHKLIQTTHRDSFRDDPLRILRALRFVSTLGYDLSTQAKQQMHVHAEAAHGLSQVYKQTDVADPGRVATSESASGTVLAEMSKLLMGDDCAKALRLMRDSGVMAIMFPELAPMLGFEQGSKYHDLTTDEHVFTALEAAAKADAPLRVRWALLFHDAGKPESAWVGDDGRKHYYSKRVEGPEGESFQTEDHEVIGERLWRQAAKRMNVPKDLREAVATLIREHMVNIQPKNVGVKVRRARVKFGDELLRDLYLHRTCDAMGKQRSAAPQVRQIGELMGELQAAQNEEVPCSIKELKVAGADVVAWVPPGRIIGEALAAVLDDVVCQPDELRRTREWQLTAVKRHVERLA